MPFVAETNVRNGGEVSRASTEADYDEVRTLS
jgi:hypothetical protein